MDSSIERRREASPVPLSPGARAAVAAGMPDSTRRAYQDNVRWFEGWCRATGRSGLPADAEKMTEYATYLAYERGWAPVSIERARWAIVKWHSLAGFPLPATAGLVTVLRGYRERLAKSSSPKAKTQKAAAANGDTLRSMLQGLDRTTAAGKRNAAILLLGFSIAGRRGEIASLDIESIDAQAAGIQVTVYRQKVRKMDDPVVMYRADEEVCPVRATLAWIETLAANGRESGPLFVRVNLHDQIGRGLTRNGVPIGDPAGRMTGQAVAQVIQRCARAAKLGGKFSGHSLRRGFATSAHTAGLSRDKIERQGGWTPNSVAVSGYIDDAERWLYDVLDGVL